MKHYDAESFEFKAEVVGKQTRENLEVILNLTKNRKKTRERSIRDRKFSFELELESDEAKRFSQHIVSSLINYEKREGLRKRARRAVDLKNLYSSVECIVANLAHEVFYPTQSGQIAVSLHVGGESIARYTRQGFGKTFSTVLLKLKAIGIVELNFPSGQINRSSTIKPTEGFILELKNHDLSEDHIKWGNPQELIILNKRMEKKVNSGWGSKKKVLVNYPETQTTRAYRKQLSRINDYLTKGDIKFLNDGLKPCVDESNRSLKRVFNLPPHIEINPQPKRNLIYGGRLFGGFWQTIKRERRANIRIEGETITEVDYSQMFPRLAYSAVGGEPLMDNLYDLDGLPDLTKAESTAVKKAFNTLLFASHTVRFWPEEFADDMPQGWNVGRLKRAIIKTHPSLKDTLNKGIGYELMFRESKILCEVMEQCMKEGILCLPNHDAVLCPKSKSDHVRKIMERVSTEITGHKIPVKLKEHLIT